MSSVSFKKHKIVSFHLKKKGKEFNEFKTWLKLSKSLIKLK